MEQVDGNISFSLLISKNEASRIYNVDGAFEVPNLKCLGNIQRCKLWLEDTPQTYIYPHLELQSDHIQALLSDGGKVLVHCVAGVSRSASICLAYLTKYKCRSLRDAYHLMAKTRPMVRPNLGFWRQLIAFEQVQDAYCLHYYYCACVLLEKPLPLADRIIEAIRQKPSIITQISRETG